MKRLFAILVAVFLFAQFNNVYAEGELSSVETFLRDFNVGTVHPSRIELIMYFGVNGDAAGVTKLQVEGCADAIEYIRTAYFGDVSSTTFTYPFMGDSSKSVLVVTELAPLQNPTLLNAVQVKTAVKTVLNGTFWQWKSPVPVLCTGDNDPPPFPAKGGDKQVTEEVVVEEEVAIGTPVEVQGVFEPAYILSLLAVVLVLFGATFYRPKRRKSVAT